MRHFAGKTTELVRRVRRYQAASKLCLMLNYKVSRLEPTCILFAGASKAPAGIVKSIFTTRIKPQTQYKLWIKPARRYPCCSSAWCPWLAPEILQRSRYRCTVP